MKYTREQKQRMAEAFRKAAAVLTLENTPGYNVRRVYICLALDDAESDYHTVERCCKLIEQRLGQYSTLKSWLMEEAKIPRTELTFEAVQRHRLAWLKLLIEEFSA